MRATPLLVVLPLQFMLAGCATSIQLTPQLSGDTRLDCRVLGHVSYEGNREYLPPVLVDNASSPVDSVLHYAHEARYGLDQLPTGAQLVNPLHLIGFPTGTSSLAIMARLDVMRGGSVVRSFAAVAAMQGSTSIFPEGETFTDMRRRGLLLVRDNISAQVCADLSATQAILDAARFVLEREAATP
jgi:hypothetical protein